MRRVSGAMRVAALRRRRKDGGRRLPCGCAPQREAAWEAAALRLRTTATALRLGTRAEGALHGARSYRCAKVVDEKSMRDHVACAKTRTRDVWVVCSLSESFFLRFDEPILGGQ